MPITPHELLTESTERRSYRSFSKEAVDLDLIKTCLLTASTAPSGANKQPWHFAVVTDLLKKKEIREAAEAVEQVFYQEKITKAWANDLEKLKTNWQKPFLEEAPCLIVIFKELYSIDSDGTENKNYYVNESTGIAIGLLINALRNAGYASLTYTPAPPTFLRDMLHRPKGESPVMILCVGKKDETFDLPVLTKKTLGEIASFF